MAPRRTPPTTMVLMVIVMNIFSGDSLTCHPAEYQVNHECCPMCQAGSRVKTDCTEFRSTSCLPCVEGTFTEKPNGLKRCLSCTTCDPGSGLAVKTSCTVTSDAVCEPLEGFLCIDSTTNGCAATKRHRSCEPGQYIQQEGTAFTDTRCSNCSDGTFSNGSGTTCQQHTKCEELDLQQITAGTTSADAQCGTQSSPGTRNRAVPLLIGSVLIVVIVGIVGIVVIIKREPKGSLQQPQPINPDGTSEDPPAPEETQPLSHSRGNGRTELKTENPKAVGSPEAELKLFNETESDSGRSSPNRGGVGLTHTEPTSLHTAQYSLPVQQVTSYSPYE